MELASTLFLKYGWQFCGTMAPTDKKGQSGDDVPFNKLSPGALWEVSMGWFQEAIIWKKTPAGKKYAIQATTWRDKKQVLFLHTTKVGRSNSIDTKRHVKGKQEQITIQSTQAQQEYVQNYGGVDRNDRDSAEYSTTIQTHRWYLCIFFWLFDHIIHMLHDRYLFFIKGIKLEKILRQELWKSKVSNGSWVAVDKLCN